MSQTVDPFAKVLPGLPKRPLTAEQQLDAISRVQSQAESRVELGLKLFKAAENHTRSQQQMLEQIKTEQKQLRDQVQEDVARSLQTYDQWVGQIDDNFTKSMQQLESKIERLQENWMATQTRIEAMLERSAEMFAQSNNLPQQPVTHQAPALEKIQDVIEPEIDANRDVTEDDENKSQDEPRLKPESGTLYTDLLKQLREQTTKKKPDAA
ncbi:MAG: hypothetical protein JKX85_01015 [Phycisphaeraceae bacterium]|nr:hypothetical protein [Phycisphaeraceae bacterium]